MGKLIGRFVIIGGVAVVGVAVLFMLFATQPQPQRANSAPRPVAVFVAEAERGEIALTVDSQGEAQPRNQINLVPQVAGRITFVNPDFIEGGFFEAGETLIQIDDADYRLAVTRASAQVAQAQQALAREQAESELAASEWEELGEGQASALTLREPQLAEARAQLAAAQAALQSARLDLQRTQISAPFAGRVRSKNAGLGQYVSPGTNLGEVFATDTVMVRLPLTDHDLSLLGIPVAYNAANDERGGVPVVLSATVAGGYHEWEGRITRTDSAIDPQTRVLYAIAEVTDPYGSGADDGAPLAIGLFVNAAIQGREVDNAYIIPRNALRGEDSVYIVREGGTLEIHTVDIIDSSPERVIVSSGVEAGDLVVVSPIRGASTGMRVHTYNAGGEQLADYSANYEEAPEGEETGESVADGEDAVASAG
ncbi:efflux RND transporter periplasmic adaptor subunit [Maricaulis sp.]|uniref:efflux RND transporter periplasmic adaptor subunit n=1 Tax=Maricaulis sp. TaxID=1486257 RepID=UPI00329701E2